MIGRRRTDMEATIRIGAACVMTAASAWGGRMMACAQARRAETLRELAAGVKRLKIEMLERRLPLHEALSLAGGAFGAAAGEMEGGAPPEEAWRRARERLSQRGALLDSLTGDDCTALGRLFQGLGAGGLQSQRLVLSEAEEEISRLYDQARRKREEQGKLYASLGALGGLALALILL